MKGFVAILILVIALLFCQFVCSNYVEGLKADSIFSESSFSFFIEKSFGKFFPYFSKSVALITLLLFFRKGFYHFILLFAIVFLLLPSQEILSIPFIVFSGFLPFYFSALFSFLIPFFAKIGVVGVLISILLRAIIFDDKREYFPPLLGFLSPPIILSILRGDLFLPILLSSLGFLHYKPIELFTPPFFFFFISLILLFLDEKKRILKFFLSILTFFFSPFSTLIAIPLIKMNYKKLNLLFLIPLILIFVYPQKVEEIPKGIFDELKKVESIKCSVVCDISLYNQIGSNFKNFVLKPEIGSKELTKFYKSFPLRPPLIGYTFFEGDLIICKSFYPNSPNLRGYGKGFKLVFCGKDYALFGKEQFLSMNGIKPLNYSPYFKSNPLEVDQEKVLSEIDFILSKEPLFYEALRDKGRILIDLKRSKEALVPLTSALHLKKSAEIYNDLGVAYFNIRDYEKAMECYIEAIKLSPREVIPRMSYAYTALLIGKFEDAEIVLQDLNRAYPTYYPAFRLHYEVLTKKGEMEKAKEVLRKIPKEFRSEEENEILGKD